MEPNVSAAFPYQALASADSIRLLLLQPGTPDSPIYCHLEYTTLEECRYDLYGHYTALSYVWGDTSERRTIFVESQPFEVTANLCSALENLRHEKKKLRIWIDAICIDQSNIAERSHQVSLMKGIYSLAKQTVVYLGPSDERSDFLFEALRVGENQALPSLKQFPMFMELILKRRWFTRVWIFQELVLSKQVWVQIGRKAIDWDLLTAPQTAHRYLRTTTEGYAIPGIELFIRMNDARHKYRLSLLVGAKRSSIPQILAERRDSRATDARDIVYGHLAIVDNTWTSKHLGPLVIDYSKSCATVFTDTAGLILESPECPRFLRFMELRDSAEKMEGLPSWVPDWSLPESSYLMPLPRPFVLYIPVLLGDDLGCLSFIQHRIIWACETCNIGTVTKLSGTVRGSDDPFVLSKIHLLESIAFHQNQPFDPPDVMMEAKVINAGLESLFREVNAMWQDEIGSQFLPELQPSSLSTYFFEHRWMLRFIEAVERFRVTLRKFDTTEQFLVRNSSPSSGSPDPFYEVESVEWHMETLECLLMGYGFQLPGTQFLKGRKIAIVTIPQEKDCFAIVPPQTKPGDVLAVSKYAGIC
ncbi:hypothetical protein IFR05_014549 [Cadophora sp. M221]|nr:hypothetical protein IFR05_014549 [Cadophora sp. M221]